MSSGIIAHIKELEMFLRDEGILDKNDVDYFLSSCPWYGNGMMKREEVKRGTLGWRCHSCGRRAV